jgi:hypothetical protein
MFIEIILFEKKKKKIVFTFSKMVKENNLFFLAFTTS